MPNVTHKSAGQVTAENEVESFREHLGPFVVAAETTRMPMVFTNAKLPNNLIIFANDSFLKLTGYARDELLGKSFDSLLSHNTASNILGQFVTAFREGTDLDSEIKCIRKDGTIFWAALFVNPVRDTHHIIVQHFTSFIDLTKHKQEQAQSAMLIDELNHRVKNTLSTVQSIVTQAMQKPSSPKAIQEFIESRIFALSRSHDLLARENWQGAGLHDLLDAALKPFGVGQGRAERFIITGPNIRLSPKTALALGIALHELATNAVKYGAFSNEAGSIQIAWTLETTPQGQRLMLRWQEKDGPPVTPPSRKGFGTRVIERGLALELNGIVKLEYKTEGLLCTINFPAPEEDTL